MAETITNLALSALIGEVPTPPVIALPPTPRFAVEEPYSNPNLINGRVVCLEQDWPRLLCRQISGIDVYVDSETGRSGLMVEGLAAISGISSREITSLAKNLKGKRQGLPVELKRVTKDKVYVVESQSAVVNGKGEELGVTGAGNP